MPRTPRNSSAHTILPSKRPRTASSRAARQTMMQTGIRWWGERRNNTVPASATVAVSVMIRVRMHLFACERVQLRQEMSGSGNIAETRQTPPDLSQSRRRKMLC